MKKKLLTILSAFLLGSTTIQAQCITTSAYGSATISTCPTGSTAITTCNYKGEYSELTFNMTGAFTFDATSASTIASYLTLTDALNNVIAFGPPPLQATITTIGGYRLHITDASCGSESVCHTTSYACVLPICSGMPTTGTLTGSSFTICPSSSVSFSVSGATQASGITYQWQESTSASGPFANVTAGIGGTTMAYTTGSLTTNMYYQMVITCTASAMSATTSVVSVYPTNPVNLCYCQTNLGGSGCSGDNITNVTFISTGLNNTSACNTTTVGTYTQFTPGAGTTATLTTGSSYSITINTTANNIESLWIDYNQNGIYDATEHSQICTTSTPSVATGYNLLIPASAMPGLTGMRIRSRGTGNPNSSIDACTNFGSGETEDYTITLIAGSNCSGAPSAGTTPSSINICPNNSVTISSAGSTSSVGITYQWQESTSATGPFTNVTAGTGGTTMAYTTGSLTANMYYQMIVTCTVSAMSATTGVTSVLMNPASQCYCITNLGGSACSGDNITNVTIMSTSFNNTSACNTTTVGTYTQFSPGAGTTATLTAGSSYSITINTTADNIESVWIDYNQNGMFETTEHSQICTTSTPSVATGFNLMIPVTALVGQTGMRVRSRAVGNPNGAADACASFGSGETEDYMVNIDFPTNLKNAELNAGSLTIYPNPANEMVSIFAESAPTNSKVFIYNTVGDLVAETMINATKATINTANFPAGIYIVKLVSGTNSISKKLVIYK